MEKTTVLVEFSLWAESMRRLILTCMPDNETTEQTLKPLFETPAANSGHVLIEMDMDIDDNGGERLHHASFFLESELGLIESFGKNLKRLVEGEVASIKLPSGITESVSILTLPYRKIVFIWTKSTVSGGFSTLYGQNRRFLEEIVHKSSRNRRFCP
jgi:hypothetical protein